MRNPTPLVDRFNAMCGCVDSRGCIPWLGYPINSGYGHIGVGRRKGGFLLAHRAAWILKHGVIPDGLYVLHNCDNKLCVNVEHLRLGTQFDNMADAIAMGSLRRRKPKMHCPKGHPYDEENTYHHGGSRHCKACQRARDKNRSGLVSAE